MIKDYKLFKESLLDKLEGLTKKEIMYNLGIDESIKTPQEYLDFLFDDAIHYEMSGNQVWWERNNELILQVDYDLKYFNIHEKLIYDVFKYIFGLSKKEITDILNSYGKIKPSPEIFNISLIEGFDADEELEE